MAGDCQSVSKLSNDQLLESVSYKTIKTTKTRQMVSIEVAQQGPAGLRSLKILIHMHKYIGATLNLS